MKLLVDRDEVDTLNVVSEEKMLDLLKSPKKALVLMDGSSFCVASLHKATNQIWNQMYFSRIVNLISDSRFFTL